MFNRRAKFWFDRFVAPFHSLVMAFEWLSFQFLRVLFDPRGLKLFHR